MRIAPRKEFHCGGRLAWTEVWMDEGMGLKSFVGQDWELCLVGLMRDGEVQRSARGVCT